MSIGQQTERKNTAAPVPQPEDYIVGRPASQFLYEGQKRLLIEMESLDAANLGWMLQIYEDTIEVVAKAVAATPGPGVMDAASFIRRCSEACEILTYGENKNGFMSESIRTGVYDCDNSAILLIDVASKLGIVPLPQLVVLPGYGHALLKVDHIYYEATSGEMLDAAAFSKKYSSVTPQISGDTRFIQGTSFGSRGLTRYAQGRMDDAIEDFSKAIELNPRDAMSYSNRGAASIKQGRFDAAVDDSLNSIKIEPGNMPAYFNLGVVHLSQGNAKAAILEYSRAIKSEPSAVEAYYGRGIAGLHLGEWEAAIKDFSSVIQLNPQDADAYFKRGNAYMRLEKWALAVDDYSRALDLRPGDLNVRSKRCMAFAERGEWIGVARDFLVVCTGRCASKIRALLGAFL